MRSLVLSLMLLGGTLGTSASAAILALSPISQTVTVGEQVEVELSIAGLGNGIAPSLGAYFIELLYDSSVLALDSVFISSFLGDTDPLAFETDIIVDRFLDATTIDVFSFLFNFELDALQQDEFGLATLTFDAIGVGGTSIGFGETDLSTAFGDALTPSSLIDVSVQVEPRMPSAVPAPASLLLLVLGLALIPTRKVFQSAADV